MYTSALKPVLRALFAEQMLLCSKKRDSDTSYSCTKDKTLTFWGWLFHPPLEAFLHFVIKTSLIFKRHKFYMIAAMYLWRLFWPCSLQKYSATLLTLKVIPGMTAVAASTHKFQAFYNTVAAEVLMNNLPELVTGKQFPHCDYFSSTLE